MNAKKIAFVLFFGLVTFPFAVNAQFTRTLKLGMLGDDVYRLQKVLNSFSETRVAYDGTGSPGQESSYFGVLTQKAVIRFQEKYQDRILRPNGLSLGTGIVGKSTIKVLNEIVSATLPPLPQTPSVSTSTLLKVSSSTSQLPQANPNQKNLDVFLGAVEKISRKKGLSSENILKIKGQIVKDAATTTDLRSKFIKIVESKNRNLLQSSKVKPSLSKGLGDVLTYLVGPFIPKQARAVSGTPFGGAVIYSYFCSCSGNWLITLEPLPPTFVALLTYTEGSQAYLSFNIPFTEWLLGEYTQGGQCSVYVGEGCADIPSEGEISSKVGSSPE